MRERNRIQAAAQRITGTDSEYWVCHQRKLIYLSIPKNANSYLRALFLWNHPLAYDFDPGNETALSYHQRAGRRGIALRDRKWLHDPAYTSFVVLRDPMARTVSAYLDKIAKKIASRAPDQPSNAFYRRIGRVMGQTITPQNLTFAIFVRYALTLNDLYRNRHYRSQHAFLGHQRFDYYADFGDMPAILCFLETQGLDTNPPAIRSPKRTRYARHAHDRLVNAAHTPLADLNRFGRYPPAPAFFDRDLLDRFRAGYEPDIELYAWLRGQRPSEMVQPYRSAAKQAS